MTAVGVGFDVLSDEEKGDLQKALGRGKLPQGALAKVKNVICVSSGKGGVGKSTMTANLAAALTAEGHPSGALDCDVYGYSIPRMLGVNAKPDVNGERKILPLDSPSGVKVMSIGFFVEENAAVVWRGPMLHKAIQQSSRTSPGTSWSTCCWTCRRGPAAGPSGRSSWSRATSSRNCWIALSRVGPRARARRSPRRRRSTSP